MPRDLWATFDGKERHWEGAASKLLSGNMCRKRQRRRIKEAESYITQYSVLNEDFMVKRIHGVDEVNVFRVNLLIHCDTILNLYTERKYSTLLSLALKSLTSFILSPLFCNTTQEDIWPHPFNITTALLQADKLLHIHSTLFETASNIIFSNPE